MIVEQKVTYTEWLFDRSEFLTLTTLFFLMSDTPVHVVQDIKDQNFNMEAGVQLITLIDVRWMSPTETKYIT